MQGPTLQHLNNVWKNVFHKGKRNTKFTYNWHSKEYYELSPKFCHNKNFKQAWLSYSCTWHSELKNGVLLFSFLKKFWNILIFKSLRYQSCNPLNMHTLIFSHFFHFYPNVHCTSSSISFITTHVNDWFRSCFHNFSLLRVLKLDVWNTHNASKNLEKHMKFWETK